MRRPDRSWAETTTTVRADVGQDIPYTTGAEGAFVTTNSRLKRVGREIGVAVLARGSELQHSVQSFAINDSEVPINVLAGVECEYLGLYY